MRHRDMFPKSGWQCQVQLMKQFDLELVWYGAGNAIFAHRLAAHLLGLLRSPMTLNGKM